MKIAWSWGRLLLTFSFLVSTSVTSTIAPASASAPIPTETIAQTTLPVFTMEFSLPGTPEDVAVQSPQVVWATLPTRNQVARLTLGANSVPSVTLFTLPTPNAGPYAIAFAAGAIWVTERNTSKIARLDPLTGIWSEYPTPTPGARPADLRVVTGTPVRVWFAESGAGRIGELVYTSPSVFTVNEYVPAQFVPALPPGAPIEPQGIDVDALGRVWFTLPTASRLGFFQTGSAPGSPVTIYTVSTGASSEPWTVKADTDGYPWVTDRKGNRIGKYFPTTLTFILWHQSPFPNSGPYDLALKNGAVWFTERDGNRFGRLNGGLPGPVYISVANSAPAGIDIDATDCIWVAGSGRTSLLRSCPPYFHYVYLPINLRNAP